MEKFTRQCPKCGKDIQYKTKRSLERALKANAKCTSCRIIIYDIDKFEKICPQCGKLIQYKNRHATYSSIKSGAACFDCSHKFEYRTANKISVYQNKCSICKRITNYKSKSSYQNSIKKGSRCERCARQWNKNSIENLLTRNCPRCQSIIHYTNKHNRHKSEKEKRLCSSCSQKTYTHTNKFDVTERKCPECSQIVFHKSRVCMLRAWKKNVPCKFCMRKRLGKPNYNPKACKYFDTLNELKGWNLRHALNGGEYHVRELNYWVDAYDYERNIVVEYDEPKHYDSVSGELKQYDKNRQKQIMKYLQCQFYRFNERTDKLNVFSLSESEPVCISD